MLLKLHWIEFLKKGIKTQNGGLCLPRTHSNLQFIHDLTIYSYTNYCVNSIVAVCVRLIKTFPLSVWYVSDCNWFMNASVSWLNWICVFYLSCCCFNVQPTLSELCWVREGDVCLQSWVYSSQLCIKLDILGRRLTLDSDSDQTDHYFVRIKS